MSKDKDQKFYPGGWTPEQREQAANFGKPAGFPVSLIVQVLLAVLNFLIQRASDPGDMKRLIQLREELEAPLFGGKAPDECRRS